MFPYLAFVWVWICGVLTAPLMQGGQGLVTPVDTVRLEGREGLLMHVRITDPAVSGPMNVTRLICCVLDLMQVRLCCRCLLVSLIIWTKVRDLTGETLGWG